MRLSFSTNAYVRTTVCDAVERIARAGYAGVELLADRPHLYADGVESGDLDRLGTVIRSLGIGVANINANTAVGYYGATFWEPVFEPSLAHPDPALRRWRADYTRKCIDFAVALGCGNVSITSGRAIPGLAPEASLGLLADSLHELLDYAGPRGVRLGIEYEPGLLVENCRELGDLLERVGSPWLGANLDLGHSHVAGEDPKTVLSLLGERVFHVHIEDIRGRKHYHLVPGEGDLDFGRLFGLLQRAGYRGYVTVELYTCPERPDEAALKALRHLAPYLDQQE